MKTTKTIIFKNEDSEFSLVAIEGYKGVDVEMTNKLISGIGDDVQYCFKHLSMGDIFTLREFLNHVIDTQ